jgi:hydroxymethylpyrimidine/phosphomethylpyrimidine kinase
VLDDLDVQSIKTGMLYDEHITRTVARVLKGYLSAAGKAGSPPLICDPVCVSTSGHTLLKEAALDALISELFPLCTVITPNKSEAELLLSRLGKPHTIESLEDMIRAAEALVDVLIAHRNETISTSVLLKGGHITASFADLRRLEETSQPNLDVIKQNLLVENMEILQVDSADYQIMQLAVDVLCQRDVQRKTLFVRPWIDSENTHGTGCTLSSAIASELAKGSSRTAVFSGCHFSVI